MSADNASRPRRLAGHRPSTLGAGSRPRKVADSRRVAVRPAPPAPVSLSKPPTAPPAAPAAPRTDASGPAVTGAAESMRRRPGRLTLVLVALAGVLAVVVGMLVWDLLQMDARADARKAAQVVAAESVETILSYDHASYDKGVTDAKTLMTEQFAAEYSDTVDTVRPEVLDTESVVKAEVVASSVVSADPDRVKALLFVNQTTTGKQVEQPRVDLNRVVVTLERDGDGAWLVADIDAL